MDALQAVDELIRAGTETETLEEVLRRGLFRGTEEIVDHLND